jgi:hypothetical protein
MTRVFELRREQPPDDATVVLRAGVMSPENIRRSAERTFALYSVYGISVEGVIDVSVLDACRTSERLALYRHIRLSTFGRLRSSGFALLATFVHPHFTVVLADVSDVTIARLERCFEDPIPNPARPLSQ